MPRGIPINHSHACHQQLPYSYHLRTLNWPKGDKPRKSRCCNVPLLAIQEQPKHCHTVLMISNQLKVRPCRIAMRAFLLLYFLIIFAFNKALSCFAPIWFLMFPLKVYKNPVYIYNKTENYYPPYSEDLKNLSLRSASSTFVNHLSSIVTIFLVTRRRWVFRWPYIVHHLSTSFASKKHVILVCFYWSFVVLSFRTCIVRHSVFVLRFRTRSWRASLIHQEMCAWLKSTELP